MLWEDPLSRDDVKPLRPFEFEAIGKLFEEKRSFSSFSVEKKS
jgi:hypothetical protein